MNELSWILYLAETLPEFAGWMKFFGIVLGIVFVIMTVILFVMAMEDEDTAKDYGKAYAKCWKVLGPWTIVAILLSTLIPPTTTFYLIAGSEMGEAALKTEAAQKVEDYLTRLLEEKVPDNE